MYNYTPSVNLDIAIIYDLFKNSLFPSSFIYKRVSSNSFSIIYYLSSDFIYYSYGFYMFSFFSYFYHYFAFSLFSGTLSP